MQPVISIIISVYNRERYLGAAIESVLAQTRRDFELLIWDDGSSDNSVAIARRYEKLDHRVRVVVGENQGTTKVLKAAIAQTCGKYIGWVDSDDLLAPTALQETSAVLDAQSDIGWVYTDYLDIDADNQILSYGYRCLIPYNRDQLLHKFMTFHFRLIRRETFMLAGGIDESFKYVEDYDLCLRLAEVAQVKHIFQPLYYYRQHTENISHQYKLLQARFANQAVKKAQKRRNSQIKSISVAAGCLLFGLFPHLAQAQSIIPAHDGTGTIVNTQGNNIEISGGSLSSDRANLFHSFSQFGLDAQQTANFLSQPSIQNILGRVTGNDASLINGMIKVTGGNSNLYLINPNGIIFGNNASLNIPASFTATTANRIGFNNSYFQAHGWNNYAALIGIPQSFAFDTNSPSAIFNAANLTVNPGNNLTLLGGTVASTGNLTAPGGSITVASVPGSSLVRLSIPGNLLSLEIIHPSDINDHSSDSLPQLLTGGTGNHATQFIVNSNGEVELTGSGLQVNHGDVVLKTANADTVNVYAHHNLILPQSKINTTGDLNLVAQNNLQVRDSTDASVSITAGKNLYLQGNQGIDILAINHINRTTFISGGDLTLVSNGKISLDTHFASGGKFSILNNAGNRSSFISLYDPIISANEDVSFNDYTGPALKVETRGSITAGNIEITSADTTLCTIYPSCSGDIFILANEPALILRAGLIGLELPANTFPVTELGTQFNSNAVASNPGNIQVGNIQTSIPSTGVAGRVILQSLSGDITTGNINSSATNFEVDDATAGSVNITTPGNITTGKIDAFAFSSYGSAIGGDVNLNAGKNITFATIDTNAIVFNFADAEAGNVNILANGVVRGLAEIPNEVISPGTIFTDGDTISGVVTIQHDGGADNIPFIVGDASANGTQGRINTGISEITPTSPINTFPVLPNGGTDPNTPNNIVINSINTPPTLTANNNIPTSQGNQTLTFTLSNLNVGQNDVNQDNLTIRLAQLKAGNLTFPDGTPVTPGTILQPDTILVYTPPNNAKGNITAFSINASDRVSFSSPQDITIQVAVPDNAPNPNPPIPIPPPTLPIIPGFKIDPDVGELEQKFTDKVQQYLGRTTPTKIANTNTAQTILQDIEKATGVKPALIYVSFVPKFTTTANQVTQTKALDIISPDDRLELLVVTSNGTPIRKVLPITRSQILGVSRTFKSRITDPALRRDYFDAAKQLYDWLIQPIETDLTARKIQNLVFIMDSGLRSLPIAALYDGKQYLVEKYSVGLMPSLSLTNTQYVDIRNAKVLGMGASQFTNQQPLPAVPTELQTITPRLWPGKAFLNEAFTLENLQNQRQQTPFGIIHLATHGEFKPGAPSNSYIQLWDSQLQMDQIRRLSWNNPPVELVVLSACRTALGDETAELGFAGFAVQAGAKSVLASLWYVSDEGTLGFISEFYDRLKTAPIKAEALRQAQVAALKGDIRLEDGKLATTRGNVTLPPVLARLGNKNINHPYFWSAFTMIGNPW